MTKQVLASLVLATLTTSAFALPGKDQPFLVELRSADGIESSSQAAPGYAGTFASGYQVARQQLAH